MGASSQTKSFVVLIKCANLLFLEILHVENSSSLNGILNRECAVLPPLIKSAAIPEEATANAISPHNLTFASIVLYKNLLFI